MRSLLHFTVGERSVAIVVEFQPQELTLGLTGVFFHADHSAPAVSGPHRDLPRIASQLLQLHLPRHRATKAVAESRRRGRR
eukprot:SAG31_NODE_3896_length_3772_cov_12.045467_1_plen_81_part_00